MAEIGQVLNGRYRLVKDLGAGGMGLTYIAEDIRLPGNPKCAIKHLKPSTTNPNSLSTFRTLFKREVEALRQLSDHDQIPRLIDDFEEGEEFYLVREYIEGHPLKSEMALGIRWTEPQVIQMLQEVLSILNFVHSQGVIHRDIKPENIIRRQRDGKLVLIDFGAVKRMSMQPGTSSPLVSATNVVGTFGYMAAEQGQGRPKLNSDIYSLGIVGIQALTGILSTQFQEDEQTGELVWQHYVQASSELKAILTKMVKTHFKDRYQSAAEVLKALEQFSLVPVKAIAGSRSESAQNQRPQTPNSVPPNLRISANGSYPQPDPSSQPTVPAVRTSNAIAEQYIPQSAQPTQGINSSASQPTIVSGAPLANTLPASYPPLPPSPPTPPPQAVILPNQPAQSPATYQQRGTGRIKVAAIAAGIVVIAVGGVALALGANGWKLPSLPQVLPQQVATKLVSAGGDKKLTIGVVTTRGRVNRDGRGTRDAYAALRGYLKSELGTDVDYELVEVQIQDKQKAIDEVKQKLKAKEWDVAFTFMPALSIVAQDNGYVYAARMTSRDGKPEGKSVFFVKNDSPIQRFDDIVDNPNLKIALGTFDHAQAFYVPLFHLYGTTLRANYGNSPREIREKVLSGNADVGVGDPDAILRDRDSAQVAQQNNSDPNLSSSNATVISNSPNQPGERKNPFRLIKSRNEDIAVPRAGVYISPKISPEEREAIARTLLKAPKTIQEDARYGAGEEPDYTNFRKVASRVNEILNCADYRSNQPQDSNQYYPAKFWKRNGCS